MSERQTVTTFYRIAHGFPPPDTDYRTSRQKGRKLRANANPRDVRSFDGLSSSDIPEWCQTKGKQMPGLGDLVVRYHIPDGSGISWEGFDDDPNHFDLYGDPEELKQYLDHSYRLDVPRRSR